MTKLNYMIHLLEENKDEKTQNVTEELVLYMFLGVFVIFVIFLSKFKLAIYLTFFVLDTLKAPRAK